MMKLSAWKSVMLAGALTLPLSIMAIERVNYGNNDLQTNGPVLGYGVSEDGRYVVFGTNATNLDARDTNGTTDIYYFDTQTRQVHRVSADINGVQLSAGASTYPGISGDGHYIVYQSKASLVAEDTNFFSDIYVYDTQTQTNRLISVGTAGEASDNASYNPSISTDGRYVSFNSYASNLVAGDGNKLSDVFVYDLSTGQVERILGNGGIEPNGHGVESVLSSDGRYVAYGSMASNVVANDTNNQKDVFLYDRQTGINRLVSISETGVQPNKSSSVAGVSDDGRFVSYYTDAANIVNEDTNSYSDVFIHDFSSGSNIFVSRADNGAAANRESYGGRMSADGRYVVFNSYASNLVANDSNGQADAFIFDRVTQKTERLSLDGNGVQANGASMMVAQISHNGRFALFRSFATNLVANDTNKQGDVFMVTRATNSIPVANAGGNRQLSCSGSLTPVLLDGSASSDQDGDPLIFTWTGPFATQSGVQAHVQLPLGVSVVTLQVDDGRQGIAQDSATITIVDDTAPWLNPLADQSLEATSVDGAQTQLQADAGDSCGDVQLSYSPLLSWYPLGTTPVQVTATDAAGNQNSITVNVTVQDTTPPLLTVPADQVVEANGVLSTVSLGQAQASDLFDVSVHNDAPAAGYPIGTTAVTWTATDSNGNVTTAVQNITVQDTRAPTLNGLSSTIVAEATGALTAVDLGTPITDDVFPVTLSNDAPKLFSLGTTQVNWLAIDANGNETRFTQSVLVQDTIAPVISGLQAEIIVNATSQFTPVLLGTPVVSDATAVTISNNAPAVFPLGETWVTWTATDAAGNSSQFRQRVVLQDLEAPKFELQVLQRQLWAPDHEMVKVAVVRNVHDNFSVFPRLNISVTVLDPPSDREGHEHHREHEPLYRVLQVNGEWQIWVRAERDGRERDGRHYQIVVEASDDYGNVNKQEAQVTVGHDRRHSKRDGKSKQRNEHAASSQKQDGDKRRDGDHSRHRRS